MKVPHAKSARIDKSKIRSYLLNVEHPDGGTKAKFLLHHGFDEPKLKNALLMLVQANDFSKSQLTAFGTKYVVDGKVICPDKKIIRLRTVWMIPIRRKIPILVTAYPL